MRDLSLDQIIALLRGAHTAALGNNFVGLTRIIAAIPINEFRNANGDVVEIRSVFRAEPRTSALRGEYRTHDGLYILFPWLKRAVKTDQDTGFARHLETCRVKRRTTPSV